jgi:outer membrane protein insertion porin family
MKHTFYRYIFILTLLCSTFYAEAASTHYEGKNVSSFVINLSNVPSDSYFDDNALLSRLKTKVSNPFSHIDFDEDLKVMAKEYDKVTPIFSTINDELTITLDIWIKPTIRRILWKGNGNIVSNKLRTKLDIEDRSSFDHATFIKAFHNIKEYYIKKGYFEVKTHYTVTFVASDKNEIDLEITIEEGRCGRIEDISLKGFSKKEESDTLNLIVTQDYSFFTSWLTGNGLYREEVLEQDKLAITSYLHNRGYPNAAVDITIRESEKTNRILVDITAEKGKRYAFKGVSLEGNTLFSDSVVRSTLGLYKGMWYSPEKIHNGIRALTELYGKRGYVDAYASFTPQLDHATSSYLVKFTIHEGEQYRVGMIKIFGNTATTSRVILHESLLVPGDVFNIQKMRGTEERLQNIGYFKNVNVYTVKSEDGDAEPHLRDVNIEVEETGTGSFTFSFGVSTLEKVFGGVGFTERNFNYKGIPDLYDEGFSALRGDGEFLRLNLDVGKKHRSYMLSWAKPYFNDTPWIVGFDVDKSNSRQRSQYYDLDSLGFNVHATYPFNAYLKLRLNYRLRDLTVTHLSSAASTLLRNEALNNGVLSAFGTALMYDSTDSPRKPRKGFRSELAGEYAGIGGDFSFVRLGYVNSYYTPLSSRGVLKYRADVHFLTPSGSTTSDTLPLGERLFLGGETSVRGFRGYAIGPKYSNGDPRGGVTSALLSMEYAHTLTDRIDGFVFYDAGDVSLQQYHISKMKISYGFGFRVELFKGIPLTFGWGFPVNSADRSEQKKFFMSMGTQF